MALKQTKFKWTGLRPIIMSNVRGVDKLDPLVKKFNELMQIPNKRKTEDIWAQIARQEWEISAYWDEEIGFFMPSDNIMRCLQAGGAQSKVGKKIEAGAWISDLMIPIGNIKKHKTLDAAYKDPQFQFRTACRVPPKTGARMMKTRAMIPTGWELIFTVEYDGDTIDEKDLVNASKICVALIGIGNWRPKSDGPNRQ